MAKWRKKQTEGEWLVGFEILGEHKPGFHYICRCWTEKEAERIVSALNAAEPPKSRFYRDIRIGPDGEPYEHKPLADPAPAAVEVSESAAEALENALSAIRVEAEEGSCFNKPEPNHSAHTCLRCSVYQLADDALAALDTARSETSSMATDKVVIDLSPADQAQLVESLLNPPEPNAQLKKAFGRESSESAVDALLKAFDPFGRVYLINKPLRLPRERTLRDIIPGAWLTWGDLEDVIKALKALTPTQQPEQAGADNV